MQHNISLTEKVTRGQYYFPLTEGVAEGRGRKNGSLFLAKRCPRRKAFVMLKSIKQCFYLPYPKAPASTFNRS